MLPDDHLHLLTAAVDGELTPAEELHVRRLIAASDEARHLFARLQTDRARLRSLPAVAPPPGLRGRIMARLPRPVLAVPPATTPAPAPRPFRLARSRPWVPLAVAASLLLTISGGSFLYFTRRDDANPHPAAQTASADPARPVHPSPPDSGWADVLPKENAPLPSVPVVVEPPATHLVHGPLVPVLPDRPDEIPPPRPVNRDVNAFPPLFPIAPLDLVQVRVPFLASAGELDRDDVRQKLADELGRDPSRIDLFVKDAARGAELFQAAAKDHGVIVFADAGAQDRIRRKAATAYLVYTECLTPAELRDLFAKLAAADAKHPTPVFDTLHVAPAQPADAKDAKDVFGVDPGLWKRPQPAKGAVHHADPKPISAGTGDQLTKSLTGSPGKAVVKPAVLMTFGPAQVRTPPMMSKELRQFFDHRGDRKPAAVPVVIVIRQPVGN